MPVTESVEGVPAQTDAGDGLAAVGFVGMAITVIVVFRQAEKQLPFSART